MRVLFLSHFRIASACVSENKEAGLQHLLLFVSALIPKAFASIMSSIVVELSKPENVSGLECYQRYTLGSMGSWLCMYRLHGESVLMMMQH